MSRVKRSLLFITCLLLFPAVVFSQTKPEQQPSPPPPPRGEAEDVIKFETSLVQTDVMVFDKDGRPVNGLKPEQFQLKINNAAREISFFEAFKSGAARNSEQPGQSNEISKLRADAERRSVLFFVDDLHLAPDSLVRTKQALLEFINNRIGENDQIAITSPSGQVGFLQQFTANKDALRTAVARLNYRANPKLDTEKPPMSEYIAMKIRDGDESVMTYYVIEKQKQDCFRAGGTVMCPASPQSMRQQIRNRAQQIVLESAPSVDDTLRLLEGLMRTAAQMPGRKLVFLISDGFFLNDKKFGSIDRIKKVTDAAGRAGVVIYTLDARGIVGESIDVNRPMDHTGLLVSAGIGELSSSQDGLNALAKDTGGEAFRNTNMPMRQWVEKVMDETSSYYLLAWKPDDEEQKRGKFKNIDVSVVGRPDLKVRVRTSYFKSAALPLLTTKKKRDKDPLKARDDDMRLVVDAPVAQREIPTGVDLHFNQMPGIGTNVVATITIDDATLTYDLIDGKLAADVDIAGILYDEKGKPVNSIVGRLRIFPKSSTTTGGDKPKRSIYQFSTLVPGGLYQVRVGIRDLKSSRLGSATDWVTVPKI